MKSRTLLLPILALAMWPAKTLLAQDLTGAWQGTLQAGRDLRIVVKVSKADDGAFKAQFYSIDQSPQPMATASLSRAPPSRCRSAASAGLMRAN